MNFRAWPIWASLACALSTAGCASVTVSADEQLMTCDGVVSVKVREPHSKLISVSTRGLGIVNADDGFSAGWVSGLRIYAPANGDKCRVVLMPERPEELQQFIQVLKQAGIELSSICIAQTGETP